MSRRRRRRRRLLWAAGAALLSCVGLVVLVALAAPGLLDARDRLETARSELTSAVDAVLAGDQEVATARLDAAERSFRAVRQVSEEPAMRILAPLPLIGEPSRAMRAVALAGLDVVAASDRLVGAVDRLPGQGDIGLEGDDLAPIHEASVATAPVLRDVAERLRAAERRLTPLGSGWIEQVRGPAEDVRREIADVRVGVQRTANVLDVVSSYTSPEADARILVLSQDSYELRPTGGFVGSYGVLHFDRGTVSLEHYDDVGRLPPASPSIPAPPMLARALDQPFDLTNALWWPDFPTSARSAMQMWGAQGGEPIAGVLAFTEDTLAEVIDVVGPIDLPVYGPPVVKQGFAERVIDEVELNPLDRANRKQFLVDLAKEVFRRLLHSDAEQLRGVADRVRNVSDGGSIRLWLADDEEQTAVAPTVWSGVLPRPNGGDSLQLVEANMTAGKANAGLTRAIEYSVSDDGDGLVADLRVRYRNDGARTEINPYYNGYLRVYAPLGSVLVDNDGGQRDEGRAPDGAYQVFSADVFVEPDGGEAELRFQYRLPPDVDADGYHLRWYRQPGTSRDSFAADALGFHRIEAPPGVATAELAGT